MPAQTDMSYRALKPKEKPYKVSDGGGLFLLVQPGGGKLWRMAYRFDRKQKLLAFGSYPAVSLAEARSRRDAAKALLASDRDPGVEKKLKKGARGNTFRLVGEELLSKLEKEGLAQNTLVKKRWLLGLALDEIGDRPIADIRPPELLAVLRKVEGRGHHETARRLRSACGMVFRLAIATGRAERDFTLDLRGALVTPKVKHFATIVDPVAVGGLLRSIDEFTGQDTTRAALQIAALTFVRPGELRHAEWVEFDIDAARWTIPASKMKMRREHRVPLAPQVLAILRSLKQTAGSSKYVFPSVRTVTRPMSENTVNSALRRLGYATDEMTGHGFRSTASTLLNESTLFSSDAIEKQLAHEPGDKVRGIYNAAQYWPERVRMMNWWADHLDELRDRGRVVALRA